MKRIRSGRVIAAVMIAASIASSALGADTGPGPQQPMKRVSPADGLAAQLIPKGETPRRPDGHPDLNGNWGGGPIDAPYRGFGPRGRALLEPDQAVMQRGNAWNKPVYKPEYWEKIYNLDYGKVTDDPSFACMPVGVPRTNAPEKIVMTDKEMVTLDNGYVSASRYIPIDGRKRDEGDSDYEFYGGIGIGHWEGDTLVVESTGFTDLSWLLWTGYAHSNRMTVTERFERKGDVLYYQFTVNDPVMLAQPWVSDRYVRRRNADPLVRIEETPPCKEQDLQEIVDPYFRG